MQKYYDVIKTVLTIDKVILNSYATSQMWPPHKFIHGIFIMYEKNMDFYFYS